VTVSRFIARVLALWVSSTDGYISILEEVIMVFRGSFSSLDHSTFLMLVLRVVELQFCCRKRCCFSIVKTRIMVKR
jgi:hypothetical protein